jgi:hypothetical protein
MPGVVLHELAHYLACLMVGERVNEFVPYSFAWREGSGVMGHVVHESSAVWKACVVSLAPFALVGVNWYLFTNIFGDWDLGFLPIKAGVYGWQDEWWGIYPSMKQFIYNIQLVFKCQWLVIKSFVKNVVKFSWQDLVKLYFFASIACSWFPSGQDMRNAKGFVVLINCLIIVLYYNPDLVVSIFGLDYFVNKTVWLLIYGNAFALLFAGFGIVMGLPFWRSKL